MRALIIGASGLLGNAMMRLWPKRPGWKVNGTYHSFPVAGLEPLDILREGDVKALLARHRPEAVVILGCNPYVDYCEAHPEETRKLNVNAAVSAASAAIGMGARVLTFSTDYVFDGARGGYVETDAVNPLCEYGRQKLALERAFEGFGKKALVLRVSALFGWELRPKNFVLQVLKKLGAGERMTAASDQDYNPTYSEDLADAAALLLERGASGLLHVCGAERLTRSDWAAAVAKAFGLDAGLIVPAPLKQASSSTTPRPLHTSLVSAKAEKIMGRSMKAARRALEEMVRARADWEAHAKA